MSEAIINFVRDLIGNDYITTILISMIPVVELRGAIPAAMTMGISPLLALALAWLGSALVSPILLLILRPVLNWMKKIKIFASLANAVESGFRSKALKVVNTDSEGKLSPELAAKLEKKKMLGVYIFVAVPFPMTGVWTGSAIASFLEIPFFKAMMMVWLGNLTAGLIVTVLSIFLMNYVGIILDIFFIIVILVLALYFIRVFVKMAKSKKQAKQEAQSQDEQVEAQDSQSIQDAKINSDEQIEDNSIINTNAENNDTNLKTEDSTQTLVAKPCEKTKKD